jgi:hypothetical protein
VVLLDGNELHCLTLEEVQNLFFNRQINQDSLVCSAEDGKWQMLKRAFDLAPWMPAGVSATPHGQPETLANNPFATDRPAAEPAVSTAPPPITFNQFPPDPPSQSENPFTQSAAQGYSQNNQTETYYQAETNQTNYNFQNNQANFAPSKYSNPANSYQYAPDFQPFTETRRGARPAAVFIIVNAFFFVISNIIASAFFPASGADEAEKFGFGVGRSIIPLIIDLILAIKLWKLDNVESARKWVLVRAYLGFIVFGIIVPVATVKSGAAFLGVFSFASAVLYFLSLALVLHGKNNPSPSRIMVGIATFAIYFIVMFGTTSLGVLGSLAPEIAKFDIKNSQIEKYRVEGKEFEDKTTGAKVVLPDGWTMIRLDNPLIQSPDARMIALDRAGNRLTMLEVVPVPGNLDMKRQNSSLILDQLADGVIAGLKEEVQNSGGFGAKTANEITRMSIYIGKHPAKLVVFERTAGGEKSKGHLIITYDELTFYVLHSWCPAEEYQQAQDEFTFFEKNFSVPEKINSAFTQTAESDKKR